MVADRNSGWDFSTLFDATWEKIDALQVAPPPTKLRSKADCEASFAAVVFAINREIYGDIVPADLVPVPASEVPAILDRWHNSPQRRPLINLAQKAAQLRAYIRRIDLDERDAASKKRAERIAELTELAAPDADVISQAMAAVDAGHGAERLLLELAPKLVELLAAYDKGQAARQQIKALMADAAQARRDLIEMDAPVPSNNAAVQLPPDAADQVLDALKPLRHRLFSAERNVRSISSLASTRRIGRGDELR